MNVWENLRETFRRGDASIKLIYINVAVFILLKFVAVLLMLFNLSGFHLMYYLALPADLPQLLHRAWTPISYMFLHESFFHIFFNMLCLFWFGRMFLMYFSEKQLFGLYIIGGLLAALFYILAFNLFPYYESVLSSALLLGASGSVTAVIVATAFRSPNAEMRLFLIGTVKLKYIAMALVLISFFGITSDNSGGELAHLGGAFAGYLFASFMSKGRDITQGLNKIIDLLFTRFSRPKMKVSPKSKAYGKPMNDGGYNRNKAKRMEEIDRILDKIKASGYESLSAEEKRKLFEMKR